MRQNIDAIKLALRLDKEQRQATPEEQEILANYSGFGGIKAILNPIDKAEDMERWSKSEAELFPLVQELHEVLRENAATPEEYKRYVGSLKSSILTAFYTPQPVIEALADALKNSGIIPTRFLEPSAGTGAFISSFKQTAPQANVTSFEKDLLTGKILSHLYPQDQVRIEGYEKMEERYTGYFDVIASNIPFGDVSVFDPLLSNHENPAVKQSTRAIHNYFFVKSVMATREGGIIAFITSQGVLNSEQNKPIREHLMSRCDVVSAIRLPNNLFSDTAGTEVGSDLIILQRQEGITKLSPRQQDFIESRKLSNGISINNLFRDFDRVVQTGSKIDTDPYGKPAIVFRHEGGVEAIAKDLRKMLQEDFSKHLNVELYQYHAQDRAEQQQAQAVPAEKITSALEIKPGANTQQAPTSAQGTLFDLDDSAIKKEPTFQVAQSILNEPLVTLYDLFGFTQAERTQTNRPKGRKTSKSKKGKEEELPFMEWREELAYKSALEREKLQKETGAVDARGKEQQEGMEPVPYVLEEMPTHYREGSLVADENNRIGYLRDLKGFQPMFHPLKLSASQQAKVSLYIEIRDTYHHLYSNEATRLEANPALREMLNKLYDDFTSRFGNLNEAKNLSLIKMDAGGTEILSLERYINGKALKADIFNQPVAFNPNEITHADNAREALTASLNKCGKVNLDYMASLTGGTSSEILDELGGQVFFNPMIGSYEIKDKFISGNVISKAEHVEDFLTNFPEHEPAKASLSALKEAIPRAIPFEDLDFNFGERWIPTGIYNKYASYLFDTEVSVHYFSIRDEYTLKAESKNIKIYDRYAVKSQSRTFDGIALMKHALHNTTPDITKKIKKLIDGEMKEVKVRDSEAIQLANSKIDEIRNGFTDWLGEQSEEFKERLVDKYNRTFNCFVRPDYDGSHQTFPGLDLKGLGIPDLYKSQKDAVWMDILNGGGIVDHEVLRPYRGI